MRELSNCIWETVSSAAMLRVLADARSVGALAELFMDDHSINTRFLPNTAANAILFDVPVTCLGGQLPEVGDKTVVYWLREKDGYHYRFRSSSMGTVQHDADNMLAISMAIPKAMERTQRRRAFRVHAPLEDAQSLSIHWGIPPHRFDFPAFAHDLSATGVQLSFAAPLSFLDVPGVGSVVEITISIGNVPYTVEVRVMRMEKTGTPNEHSEGRERWMLGTLFIEPFSIFQDALENYIVQQQRSVLRRS